MGVEVAVGMAIAAIALVVVLGSLTWLLLASYQRLGQLSSLSSPALAGLRVTGALLEQNNVTLLVNVTNVGSEQLYDVQDIYVIVMYHAASGPRVQVFNLAAWPPVQYFVGSYSGTYVPGSGLMPGETLELELNLSEQAVRTEPITVTLVPLKAPEAQYTFTPGP